MNWSHHAGAELFSCGHSSSVSINLKLICDGVFFFSNAHCATRHCDEVCFDITLTQTDQCSRKQTGILMEKTDRTTEKMEMCDHDSSIARNTVPL